MKLKENIITENNKQDFIITKEMEDFFNQRVLEILG